uniref:Endonuclease/exonuclease/phosphatase domain-containing protein n=1 Tax=Anopheles atroparvus TaxID=41427 RepID=A0A182J281_ANOAO
MMGPNERRDGEIPRGRSRKRNAAPTSSDDEGSNRATSPRRQSGLSIEEFDLRRVMEAVEHATDGKPLVILGGDLNAAHGSWGSRRTTERGRKLAQTVDFLGV